MRDFIIYSKEQSTRLHYILKWILEESFLCTYHWTDDISAFESSDYFKINYSNLPLKSDLQIIPHPLLFESKICNQKIVMGNWKELAIFFQNDHREIPFDIFAASFYLISRYEEYLCEETDEHNRFPHRWALAFKENFLNLPLVDLWLSEFKKVIQSKRTTIHFPAKTFQFIPTYDIDIAYSFKGKQSGVQFLSAVKDILKFDFLNLIQRISVLVDKQKDPYDVYSLLDEIHERYALQPIYFFLIGQRSTFNKNIAYSHSLMQNLIQSISQKYKVGIHPSYETSDDNELLKKEITIFRSNKSRQHYIRFRIPRTYKQLAQLGITEEYSMGYGSINGFRASTSSSFLWFDVGENKVSNMRVFPFCYMECNSFFEQKYSTNQATQELEHYYQVTRKTEGMFIPVWHNFSLGTDRLWRGWREVYENILSFHHQQQTS
ncbi:MAG TPA: polysaccharide deacetylase family protein [Chitinophagaceae bacterium]|nr:MAG: hypothetical protein UZ11_BCD004001328 [Bacteroidetes bacterium OLB11]HMN32342.1 polysaccharide deacetylase family protein [Chitinophagaceae bacterium]